MILTNLAGLLGLNGFGLSLPESNVSLYSGCAGYTQLYIRLKLSLSTYSCLA